MREMGLKRRSWSRGRGFKGVETAENVGDISEMNNSSSIRKILRQGPAFGEGRGREEGGRWALNKV